MLKGIDPLLNADLLYILRAMGHGDEICIADGNFPAASLGQRVVRVDGASGPRVCEAILSVLPLDEFVAAPAVRMEVGGDSSAEPEVCREYQQILDRVEGERWTLEKLDRFAFYDRARECFAVVVAGEPRLYGCLILKKGIIRPDA